MNPFTIFDKTYYIQCKKTKGLLLNAIESRIANAEEESRLLKFFLVDYSNMEIQSSEVIIVSKPTKLNGPKGIGKIKISFLDETEGTLIKAKVEPFHFMFKVTSVILTIFMLFISLIILIGETNQNNIIALVTAWLIIPTILFLQLRFNRANLKEYFELILIDLKIKEKPLLTTPKKH
jgi:hypothetical protein